MPDYSLILRKPYPVKIRCLRISKGVTDVEREVRIDWEGRNIGVFAPIDAIDFEQQSLEVLVFDDGGEKIIFRMPGEALNTGEQLWASREWLERSKVE